MKYEFHIEQKMTVWEKITFRVEAESEESAIQQATEVFEFENYPDDNEASFIDFSMEPMSVAKNDNQVTRQLFYNDHVLIDNSAEIEEA